MHVARREGVLVHISGDLAQPNVTFISCATQLHNSDSPFTQPQKLMQEVLHFLSLSLHFQNYTCNRSSSILPMSMLLLNLLEAAQCPFGNVSETQSTTPSNFSVCAWDTQHSPPKVVMRNTICNLLSLRSCTVLHSCQFRAAA